MIFTVTIAIIINSPNIDGIRHFQLDEDFSAKMPVIMLDISGTYSYSSVPIELRCLHVYVFAFSATILSRHFRDISLPAGLLRPAPILQ